jgi:hypothetical protein
MLFYFGLIVNASYVIALRRLQSFPKKANETNPKSHRALTKRMEGMNSWALPTWTLGGAPSSARGEEWSVDEKTWLIHAHAHHKGHWSSIYAAWPQHFRQRTKAAMQQQIHQTAGASAALHAGGLAAQPAFVHPMHSNLPMPPADHALTHFHHPPALVGGG